MNPRDLLQAEVDALGITKAAARLSDLGPRRYGRSAVSTYIKGRYTADPRYLEEAILIAFGNVDCPWLCREITAEECRSLSAPSDPPTSSGRAMAQWRACQCCQHCHAGKGGWV